MQRFDLIIIGAGVAGLVSASGAAQLGARVALVDRSSFGGDCLNFGCVPTKRLVRSAKVASIIKRAGEFGIEDVSYRVDFPRVMESVRSIQGKIGERDDPERFRKMGVEVFFGAGRFIDPHTFEVNGGRLYGRNFIIATGSDPVVPPIPGLKDCGVLTNKSVLELKELPSSIVILGAGPIGMEYAQIFARLGSKVTVIGKYDQILPKEDKELADALQKVLEAEGVAVDRRGVIKEARRNGGKVEIYAECAAGEKTYLCDCVMAATGRKPNVEGLGLDAAGVVYDAGKGIKVDSTLRTSRRHIYGCGDVVGSHAFTHVAEYHAGIAISNALFPFLRRKVDYRVVPWATFTDPELARVGVTEAEAVEKYGGKNVKVYRHDFNENDRAVIKGEAAGRIKLVCDRKGQILGAHILGPGAGELIHEYALAMQTRTPVTKISRTIHVYPTVAQGLKRAADLYYRERFFAGWFPKVAKWLIRRGG